MLDYLKFGTDKKTDKGKFPHQVLFEFNKINVQDLILAICMKILLLKVLSYLQGHYNVKTK